MDYLSFVLCLLLAWVAIHLIISTVSKEDESNPRRLPSGPHPLPIIGNLLSLRTNTHFALAEFAKAYGPLMMVQLGRVPTVVISSAAMAKETLQKNDLSVSSRTVVDAVRALDHHERSLVWLPAGLQWLKLNRVSNSQVFSNTMLDSTQSIRSSRVKGLVSYVQKCSEEGLVVDFGELASTTTMNLLSSTLFSLDLNDPTSENAASVIKERLRGIMDETGKPNLADYFPLLRKFDPQGNRKRMSVHFQKMIDLFNSMVNQRLKGKSPSSSVQVKDALDALLEKPSEITPVEIPHLLTDFLAAGADSTSTTLEWAMAELLHNPEKLKKAKAELEEIVGRGNPVEESNIRQLPYLQAVVKETLRLHPSVALSVPRKADSEVKICGYTVPKNAQVLVNIWAIGRDPDVWEKPNLFEPERFLGSRIDVGGHDFEVIPFGAGSRLCPGWVLAMRMLGLMLGSLIHGFDWKLEGGINPKNMDMQEKLKFTLEKAQRLRAIPVRA